MNKESKLLLPKILVLVPLAIAGCRSDQSYMDSQTATQTPVHRELAPEITPPPPLPTVTVSPEPTQTVEQKLQNLPAGEYSRGNLERKEIALTFDCGASGVPTPAILEALRTEGIRATFFVTGQWAKTYPDLTRQIAAEHEIANHSLSHPDFRELTDNQIIEEINKAEQIIAEITGKSTKPFWRPPFGARDERINRVVAEAGWPYSIMWTVVRTSQGYVTGDSGDWTNITPQEVTANIIRASELGNGVIVVDHCGSTQTAASLSQTIQILKNRDFKISIVSEILED